MTDSVPESSAGTAARPPRLRPGDRVAVVAPASPVPADKLDAGTAVLRAWGLEVEQAPHVLDRHPKLDYLAGTDADRAADLERAWCDPDVAAVFCARGGYGCLRVLDLLDWDAMAAAGPKVLIGSSDVTALHQVMGPMLGLVTLFGPMIGTGAFADDPAAQERLRQMLFEPEAATVLSGPHAEPLLPGRATGVLSGGNLSLVVSGRGVRDVPDPPMGAIGLLEDTNEEPYRIDHFLSHLRRSGWLARLGGLALGSWDECGDDPAAVRAALEDRAGDMDIPIVYELGFGHCAAQLTMPFGLEAELISDPAAGIAQLVLCQPALS